MSTPLGIATHGLLQQGGATVLGRAVRGYLLGDQLTFGIIGSDTCPIAILALAGVTITEFAPDPPTNRRPLNIPAHWQGRLEPWVPIPQGLPVVFDD